MVYVHWRTQEGFMGSASSVAPPVHPELRLKGLRSMSGAHFGLRDPGRMNGYLVALAEASPEEIELGRLQVRHLLVETGEALDALSRSQPLLADLGRESPEDSLAKAVEGVAADAFLLLKEAEARPSDTNALRLLAGALDAVAEAEGFAATLASGAPGNAPLAARASHLAQVVLAASDRFREQAGARCPAVSDAIRPAQAIRAAAVACAAIQARLGDGGLVPERLDRAAAACGGRDGLWLASQHPHREAEISAERHHPFGEDAAEALRAEALALCSAFDATFNTTGFVALVRQAAASARWSGLRQVAASRDTGEADRIRRRYARVAATPGSEEAERLDAAMQAQIDALPARRAHAAEAGRRLLAAGQAFDALVAIAAGLPARPVLRLRASEGGVVTGSFDGEGSVLVIHPDPTEAAPEAVRAFVILAGLGGGPLPGPDELEGVPSASYGSLAEAVAALSVRDRLMSVLAGGAAFAVADATGEEPELAGPRP